MTRPARPTDADTFGDLPSPDEYAANGYRLKSRLRYDREMAAWRNREKSAARAAIAVTDTSEVLARRLLVGGVWIDGLFRPVWTPDPAAQLGWISDDGVYVTVDAVQARDLAGAHRSDWSTYLRDEPAEDCTGAGDLAYRDHPDGYRDDDGYVLAVPAEPGMDASCPGCERWLPVVDDGNGIPVLTEHDRRGRRIEDGRTVWTS